VISQKKQRGWEYMRKLGNSPKVPRPADKKASRVLEKNLPTVGPMKAAALTFRRSERVYVSGEGGQRKCRGRGWRC